jgi:RNA-directed DNA polymerase
MLSNILLFDLDTQLFEAATEANVVYTRYADDITASGATIEDVERFDKIARTIVARAESPRLTFNEEKRGIYTSGQKRMVTGLVLTPAGKISIGRERKRQISSMLHKSTLGKLDQKSIATLKGLLGFCIATEPDFVSRLRGKYGNSAVDAILRYHIPRILSRAALRR